MLFCILTCQPSGEMCPLFQHGAFSSKDQKKTILPKTNAINHMQAPDCSMRLIFTSAPAAGLHEA